MSPTGHVLSSFQELAGKLVNLTLNDSQGLYLFMKIEKNKFGNKKKRKHRTGQILCVAHRNSFKTHTLALKG